jgi:tight adherence protein C
VFGAILGPLLDRMRAVLAPLLGPLLGGEATIELRMRQVGSPLTVEAFRSRQLAWGIGATAVGVIVSFLLAQTRPVLIVVSVLLVVVFGVGGFIASDRMLQRSARRRVARMNAELPVVLEFLTLSLSAGEGILDSIRRIAATSRGELAAELGGVVAAVNTGSALGDSLLRLADALRMPALTRCIDQVVGALERGTPLAEVLRAQSQDTREQAKRELLEIAGKKEVAMMIPNTNAKRYLVCAG